MCRIWDFVGVVFVRVGGVVLALISVVAVTVAEQEHGELLQKSRNANFALLDRSENELEVEFLSPGPLGLQFKADLSVMAFRTLKDGRVGPAERCGLIHIGDVLLSVNGDRVDEMPASDAFQVLEEAAILSKTEGVSRRMRFRTSQGHSAERELSEEAKNLHGLDANMEYIDVSDGRGNLRSFHMLLGEGLGVNPLLCDPRRIVFVEDEKCCSEEDIFVPRQSLNNSIAVVKRGECSFHQKARVLKVFSVYAMLIINNEDRTFRPRKEAFTQNDDINFPVAILSSVDGLELVNMLAGNNGHRIGISLTGKLIASQDCLLEEIKEAELNEQRERNSKEFYQRGTLSLNEIGPMHHLYGELAPSGFLERASDGRRFDFIAASYSGKLPIGRKLQVVNQGQLKKGEEANVCVLTSREPDDDIQFKRSLDIQRRYFGLGCILIVSRSFKLEVLDTQLPTQNTAAVLMISPRAARELSNLAHITIAPAHNVMHKWKDLEKIEETPNFWPSNEKERRVVLSRLKRLDSEKRKESCWSIYLNENF